MSKNRLYKGSISYAKLFERMKKKGIKKQTLRDKYKVSTTVITKLNNNYPISGDTIIYLCEILKCQPGNIMEYVPYKG
jgi:Predicted transcriptional regulator